MYFNPRTPVGCDITGVVNAIMHGISIHAPQWGATGLDYDDHLVVNDFNPRTPVGCDLRPGLLAKPFMAFQSTHPSGVRLCISAMNGDWDAFQSTHPSGVRRRSGPWRFALLFISIHAPQWGATLMPSVVAPKPSYFNPRTPVGCDVRNLPCARRHRYFNPRTPVGCDRPCPRSSTRRNRFQSTHPSGVRRQGRWRPLQEIPISIHAPQWGATARMGIAFHNTEAPSVLKTDFIAKIHVHRSIHKFSNQKHQQTIHF